MQSNFTFLNSILNEVQGIDADLYKNLQLAEGYYHTDPLAMANRLRMCLETMVESLLCKLGKDIATDLYSKIEILPISSKLKNDMHLIRLQGNKGSHNLKANINVELLLPAMFRVAIYYAINNGLDRKNKPTNYQTPPHIDQTNQKENEELRKKLEDLQSYYKAKERQSPPKELHPTPKDLENIAPQNEEATRKQIIDLMLLASGWNVNDPHQVTQEKSLNKLELTSSGTGRADYLLHDLDGTILAVIEAKAYHITPQNGKDQARDYAQAIEKGQGFYPLVILTNGREVFISNHELRYGFEKIYSILNRESMRKLLKSYRLPILSHPIDMNIVGGGGRDYQLQAVQKVRERYASRHRSALLVLATGTGKTRIAIAISKLLLDTQWAKRILFVCDRDALRTQAFDSFTELGLSNCALLRKHSFTKDIPQRIYISTYQTLSKKNLYSTLDAGFFDLIIIDEAHRSIYSKYGYIFKHFYSLILGLTATPIDYLNRSTYDFFKMTESIPTYSYTYEQAIEKGHLVPYIPIEGNTSFLEKGINKGELSPERQEEFENEFGEDTDICIESKEINNTYLVPSTNKKILSNLVNNGFHVNGELGKTIIFAKNVSHASHLVELFEKMYPEKANQNYIAQVTSDLATSKAIIKKFSGNKPTTYRILVSVGMLDTGVDVQDLVNLVFAKVIRSHVQFWQMIGRGTRLCADLYGPGMDKENFCIFDHGKNFEYFSIDRNPKEPKPPKTTAEVVFTTYVKLLEIARDTDQARIVKNKIDSLINQIDPHNYDVIDHGNLYDNIKELTKQVEITDQLIATYKKDVLKLIKTVSYKGGINVGNFDVLCANIQASILTKNENLSEYQDRLEQLANNFSNTKEVEAKRATINKVQDYTNRKNITFDDMEDINSDLRTILSHLNKKARNMARVIHIEDSEMTLKNLDHTPHSIVINDVIHEQEIIMLREFISTNPLTIKLKSGKILNNDEQRELMSLIEKQDLYVRVKPMLESQFKKFNVDNSMVNLLNAFVGKNKDVINQAFRDFYQKYPSLTYKQSQFIDILKDYITDKGYFTPYMLQEENTKLTNYGEFFEIFTEQDKIQDLLKVVTTLTPQSGDNKNV